MLKNIKIGLCFVIMLFMVNVSFAQVIELSPEQIKLVEKLAEQGNVDAQLSLGFMYREGLNVEQNYKKAAFYLEKAAKQGNAEAQVNLGFLYFKGWGVEQDFTKEKEWYEKAAKQGHAIAQLNLGLLYANGQGTKQNYTKASEWFEKAAKQGNVEAQFALGGLYSEGLGVERNYDKAKEWLEKASGQGHTKAKETLGFLKDGKFNQVNAKQDSGKSIFGRIFDFIKSIPSLTIELIKLNLIFSYIVLPLIVFPIMGIVLLVSFLRKLKAKSKRD